MMGMVLSAITHAPTWDALNQTELLLTQHGHSPSAPAIRFPETIFMGRGKCSLYPGVTHQYVDLPQKKRLSWPPVTSTIAQGTAVHGDVPEESVADDPNLCKAHTRWHPGLVATGDVRAALCT